MRIIAFVTCFILLFVAIDATELNELIDSATYIATFRIHYPESMICDGCVLNFATNISAAQWNAYLPETGYKTEYNLARVSANTFVTHQAFTADEANSIYLATVYYNAWATEGNETTAEWLYKKCPTVLGNLSGSNKGKKITFALPCYDVTYDIYPYFCTSRGITTQISFGPSEISTTNTLVYTYIPPSVIENPISRAINYLVEFDGFAIDPSLSIQYDSLLEDALIPELVVIGIGFGTTHNPWSGKGTMRQYQLSPFACSNPFPAPTCSAWGGTWGGGFDTGDFIYDTVLPKVWKNLGMQRVGRERLALSGYSLGGLLALTLAYMNSTRWSAVYCSSGSFWMNGGQLTSIVQSSSPTLPIKIFLDDGAREQPIMDQYIESMATALIHAGFRQGYDLIFAPYSNVDDSHQFNSWAIRTKIALPFIYNDPATVGTIIKDGITYTLFSFADHIRAFTPTSMFAIPNAESGKVSALSGWY